MSVTSRSLLSPSQLLYNLLHNDFTESQCVGKKEQLQREILMLDEEIMYYRKQIQIKYGYQQELEKAIEFRARLRLKLQQLSRHRRFLDRSAADFVTKVKMDPLQIRNLAKCGEQLQQLRDQNCRMKVKLRELQNYGDMLQEKVEQKQKQNKIIQPLPSLQEITHTPVTKLDRFGDLDWRQKIRAYKLEEKIFSGNFKDRIAQERHKSLTGLRQMNNSNTQNLENRRRETRNVDSWKSTY